MDELKKKREELDLASDYYTRYGADKETISSLSNYYEYLNNLEKGAGNKKNYFSQWETEEDHKNYLDQVKEQERLEYLDIKEARDKKYALEQELNSLRGRTGGTTSIVSSALSSKGGVYDPSSRIETDRVRALQDEINALDRDINLASRTQTNKYLTDRAVNAEDFGSFSFEPEKEKKVINPHQQNIERDNSAERFMTEDEKAIYNYYFNKIGEAKAEEYLDSIQEDLNFRQAKAIFEGNEDNVLAQLALMAPTQGLEQSKSGFQGALRMVMGDDSYQPVGTYDYLGQMAKEDLADKGFKLPEWMGGQSIGQLAYDLVNTGANMAPSIAVGAITGTGPLAFGASAAGNAFTQKINEGYSKDQATVYGVIIGVSEATLEKVVGAIGFGGKTLASKAVAKLLPKIDNAAARIAVKYGSSMLSEGIEEGLQEVLEPLYRNAAFGENNELEITEDAIYSALLGALSGGLMEGTPYAISEGINASYQNKINEKYGKSVGEIVTEGLSAPQDSEAYKLAKEAKAKLNAGEELSEEELDVLAKVSAEVPQERKQAVTEASEAKPIVLQSKEIPNPGRKTVGISEKQMETFASKLPNATKDTGKQVAAMYDIKDGVSKETFIKGVDEAYRYGSMNFSLEEMDRGGSFAKDIPSEKKLQAYYMGQRNAETATITKANEQQKKALSGVKGKVVFEGNAATQIKNNQQRSTIRFINSVLKNASSMEYHIFASYEEDGERVYKNSEGKVVPAPNGFYDPKNHQIWIDVNAGEQGQGIMLYTLTHEHVHDIKVWSAEHYNELVKITSQAFEHAGKSFKEAVDVKYAQYKKSHPDTTYEDAQEEVVAEAMSGLLSDEKGLREFSEQIQKQDKSLWNRIKAWFNDVIARITAAYKGVEPESEEAKLLMEQRELFEKAQKVFAEAVVTAGQNYKNAGVEIDTATESVAPSVMFSERTWSESEYVKARNETARAIASELDVSLDKAYDYIDSINSVAKAIADDRARLDYDPNLDEHATVLKPNSEYGVTVDMSTLCAKRLLTTGTFDAIQKKLPNMVFDSEDIVKLRKMMMDRGYEVACGICYVESTRREMGRITQEFIDRYKIAQQTGKPIARVNASGQEVVLKSQGKTFMAEKEYTPNLGELNTTDIDFVKRDHPEVYNAYLAFMNARGQAKPKLLETRAEYKGEILKMFKKKDSVEKKNLEGGLRLQSFSDFELPHLIDMMQIVMDMSRVGLKSQAYTKVPKFAEAFGGTGIKINLSLIAKGSGVDKNGNLVFDDVEGINHEEAFRIRDKFSNNVGTILVGKSDEHIRAAMADPRIDMIIPFHKSSWKESLYEALGLTGYTDYTKYQMEKPIDKSRGKIEQFHSDEYWDYSKTGDENAQIYLQKCREDGRTPVFPQFQNEPGYWKMLIDFKMYDNDGVGAPHEVVKPIFDDDYNAKILNEYKGGHRKLPVAQDVVDDFVKEYNSEPERRYSIREIVDKNGKSYGEGVYLDSEMLSGLTDSERITMVKEYVKELGGKTFSAFDTNGDETVFKVVEPGVHFYNDKGKRVQANSDLSKKFIDKETKQEAIVLIDELVMTSTFNESQKAKHSHGVIDNFGKNNWERWVTYLQDKEKTVWEATLFVANSANGEKILYDIFPIKNVEGSGTSDTLSTTQNIPQLEEEVNTYQDRLSNADKNRVEILENKNARLEKELADLEKAYESVQNYARAEGILIGQVEQGRTMAKEMRQKQATFDRKAKGYENAIAKKKEQISAVRQQKNDLLAKAKAERAEAVERVRKADRERMEKAIADIKATERAKFNAAKERSDEQKRAIIEKYQTSIKKATEGRHRTDIRGKIKRVVNELNTLLTKQTKERHIPLELQKPVADALDILNLDDQRYYESRIRGLEARIAEAKSSEERHLLQEELNKIIDHRAAFKDKIAGLKKAYEAIRTSTDPYIAVGYNENIAKMIDRVAEDIGDTLLRDMNMTQLQEVYDLYKGILKTVRDANKFFNEEKGASVVEAGRNVVSEIEASGKTIDQISKKKLERNKFFWNNLKPVYAFKKLGSKTLENLFGGILKGQGTWAKDVSEAKDFFERIGNKYGYKKWDKKKTFEFSSNTGKKFSLNLQQMMSLYAYSKRDQAFKHLTDGGFVFDNKETIKKNGKEYVVNTAQAYNISAATLQQIIGKLSTDQRMFVDEMQKYLSETMGAKGNEVSRAMYDIELFREAEGYFPLKSAKQFLYDRNEVTNETRQLVNSGFTKPIQPGANNPIILTGFMDVWANHVNDMSMYHAFVMPIENFNKVYNFQFGRSEESDSKSVKSAIQDSFTEAANQYIEQLLKDINGGARVDSRESTYKRLIGNWKKAAVFASASVVIQQPSAIGRAFAEINPIYFMAPTEIGVLKHKKQWEQLKKYAPVAVIKEMGYFDTDMGQSTAEFIKGEKTLKDRADDIFGWAPAKADEYTWCAIWDAVKRETKAKHKDLNVNSEEFLKIAGERFTEVIDKTQVYDSVLSRSGNMRSKSIFMQMLTAFMAEPTTSANMVEQAFREAKAGHPKKALAYVNSVGASVVINSLLVSFVYALRDDDEDERFHDKYLEALLKELADGFNPLTYIPLAKDVWSIFQGWDVERVDMSLFKDLYDNLEKEVKTVKELVEGIIDGSLSEEEIKAGFKEAGEYMFPVLDTIASMNGVPLKNLRRDFYTMPKNTFKIFNQNQKELSYSEKYLWDILHEAFLDQAPFGHVFFESKDEKLFDAFDSEDKVYIGRLEKTYSSEDAYSNAAKAVIKKGVIGGEFSESQAKTYLVDYIGLKSDDAEGYIHSWKFEEKWGFAWSDRAEAYANGQIKEDKLKQAVMEYKEFSAEETDKAEKEVEKIKFKAENGFDYSARRNEYIEGNITKEQLKKALMDVDGKTSEEADMQIKLYDLQKAGFEEVTEYAVKDYYEFIKPAGISEEVYFKFFEDTKDIKGDYDSKGESIPYSKTKKIMPYIAKLPISAKQKTAVAKSFGWADKTIAKYKLW